VSYEERPDKNPQWLVKRGRQEAALDILAKYHANGDRQDALVLMEFNEIIEGIEMEQVNAQVSYLDYLKPANHHRLFLIVVIAVGSNWVGNGIISYYLAPILKQIGVTSTNQQAGLNLGLQIWNRKSPLLIVKEPALTEISDPFHHRGPQLRSSRTKASVAHVEHWNDVHLCHCHGLVGCLRQQR
jgi:hypothetical protein